MRYPAEDVTSARRALGRLWPRLRPGLWHSTRPARFCAILGDGEIRPDGGQNGNVYQGSYAASIGAVSLFDFENASDYDAFGTYRNWVSHLCVERTSVTVWIGLHRDRLPGRLILAEEGFELAVRAKRNWYPRVEACHVGLVPAGAFADVLAVSTAKPYQFETLPSGEAALPRLRELAEQWANPNPDSEIVRILRAGRDRNARRE